MTIPTQPIGSIPRPRTLSRLSRERAPTIRVWSSGYTREEFIDDLLREHETEVRRCLQKGAHTVQIDFTEGRLSMKIDPSGNLLNSFIDLNNLALSRFSMEERQRIGVHTCPGGDRDSTHSADVGYEELLPSLFELKVGNFYIALAGETDPVRVLKIIRQHMKPAQRIFIGVVAPIDRRIETPEEVFARRSSSSARWRASRMLWAFWMATDRRSSSSSSGCTTRLR